MYGYNGKALRVNLTSRDVTWDALPASVLRQFIGGTGLGTYLLYQYCPAGVEPFDPANPLIFVTSPLVGSRLTTSSKFAVLTKSPLTGCIGDALSSSFMATELKRAGGDALIITGKSPEPCLMFLHDGIVEFLDATLYWGLSTAATEHAVQGALGRRTRVGARSTFPANMRNERRAGCEDTTELTTEPESSMMLQSAWRTQRSIDMTSDSGLISQESDYPQAIQAVLDELHQMQQTPRLVTNPDALETLEREIRQRTDHLGSLLVGYHLQQALDAAALQAEQER